MECLIQNDYSNKMFLNGELVSLSMTLNSFVNLECNPIKRYAIDKIIKENNGLFSEWIIHPIVDSIQTEKNIDDMFVEVEKYDALCETRKAYECFLKIIDNKPSLLSSLFFKAETSFQRMADNRISIDDLKTTIKKGIDLQKYKR